MSQVELSVRSQLDQITKEFDNLNKKVASVNDSLKGMSQQVDDTNRQGIKNTESYLAKLGSLGKRVSSQIKDDFKTLLSINAIQDAVKITEQFRGTISEAVTLNDTIRKLGNSLGISNDKFTDLQKNMISGLGEIGLSSDVGAKALQGLVDTPVRGQEALVEYAKVAGQLASISGQQGQEGNIASGIAGVIRARGGDVNDTGEMTKVAEDIRKAFVATGKSPTDILKSMESLFSGMSKDMRESISTRGLANMAVAAQVAGPQSTAFLEQMMKMGPTARKPFEAQGFEGVFTDDGIDFEKFGEAANKILERVGGDPRIAAQTLGLSEEMAEGFVRLTENMDKVKKAQDRLNKSQGSLSEQYRNSMGLGEAFRANINKVKSILAEPMAGITGGITDVLSGASESGLGSAAVVGGGGLLAALLAGGGMRGIGKSLGLGGMIKSQAVESLTGEKVQNVYVVNASEIGSSVGDIAGAAGGLMGKGKGMLGKLGKLGGMGKMLGGVGLAAGAGYAAGSALNELSPTFEGKTSEGFEGGAIERLFFKIDKLLGGEASNQFMKNQQALQKQKVIIENRASGLKASEVSRGIRQ